MDIAEERNIAQRNFERIRDEIPSRLSEKEDKFAIQIEKAKTNPEKKLKSLYSFMNELYQFASKFTTCKKGCSWCCYYAVTVSEIEISHIEKHTKKKRNKQFLPKSQFHGTPCPFLANGTCSIYNARPFVCRRHVALTGTNTWCNPDVSNDETFPLLQFSETDKAFDYIRKESLSLEVYDIRQVFGSSA